MANKFFNKTKIFLILLFFGFIAIGCKNRVPRGFPKPAKMAEILTELNIFENTLQYGENTISTKDTHGYYKDILEKYGYTYQEFDSIRKWYAIHPELYLKVYDQVVVNLSKQETELGLLFDKENKENRGIKLVKLKELTKDPANIWLDADSLIISPTDTIDKRAPFRIETDSLELLGKLRLSAIYKFLKNDESKKPQMMLCALYDDSSADTIYKEIPHSFQKKSAVLDFQIIENKKITFLSGYLLWQDSISNPSVEIRNITLRILNDSIITENINPIPERVKEDIERVVIPKRDSIKSNKSTRPQRKRVTQM